MSDALRVYKHNRMSNEKLFNNILVHIFIQHSDNEIFFVHTSLFTIFGNVRLWERGRKLWPLSRTSGRNCPSTWSSLAWIICSDRLASMSAHNAPNVLKFPGRNPNLFNFLSSASNLIWLSALIKPDQAGEAYIKLEIILACYDTNSKWLL